MNRLITLFALAALLLPIAAWADPGVGVFTNTRTADDATASLTLVKVRGGTLVYAFTGTTDSVKFTVASPFADACYDTDITTSTDVTTALAGSEEPVLTITGRSR
jgi:hypothetical protein